MKDKKKKDSIRKFLQIKEKSIIKYKENILGMKEEVNIQIINVKCIPREYDGKKNFIETDSN